MLCASQIVTDCLPAGFASYSSLEILLTLHIAEEDANYFSLAELIAAGGNAESVTTRWVKALHQQGLIETKCGLIALSASGHDLVSDMLGAVYQQQCELDYCI